MNISKIGKSFVAITELPLPVEFDPKTLKTLGVIRHNDNIAGQHCTPHPHSDPHRKVGINSITHFSAKSHYNIYAIKDGETKRALIGSIPVQEPGYIHSFAITEQYIVLVEFPLVVNPLHILLSGKPFIENFQWKPERGTRFFVIRKEDGKIVNTYQSEAFFAFHHINAFETGEQIVVDIATMTDASVINAFYLKNMRGEQLTLPWPSFSRYTLPLDGSTLSSEVISDQAIELPNVNYGQNNGRDYQFAYGVRIQRQVQNDFLNQLVKVDTHQKSAKVWNSEGCYPGEPIFVEAPGATREDEGVILSVVFNAEKGNSFLLVLDATSFNELARAEVPQYVPFGFHGIYTRSQLRERTFSDNCAELVTIFKRGKALGYTTTLVLSMPNPNGSTGRTNWHTILSATLPAEHIAAGWPRLPIALDLAEAGWHWDSTHEVWKGPMDLKR